jgi:hypothetical protein
MCAKNVRHRAETLVCKHRSLLFPRRGKVPRAPKIEIHVLSRTEICEWVNCFSGVM